MHIFVSVGTLRADEGLRVNYCEVGMMTFLRASHNLAKNDCLEKSGREAAAHFFVFRSDLYVLL